MTVVKLPRSKFLSEFSREWKADQHASLIGPTGRGKSYTARQILSRRRGRIAIMSPKGADKTMKDFGHRVRKWPPPLWTPRQQGDQWVIRLEPKLTRPEHVAEIRKHFESCLTGTFAQQDWTVYVDELQVVSDPRMMGLGKLVEQILITGRSRNTSVMSAIQAPRWAPRAAYDQSSHVLLWRQRDKPALKRISEISGVDTDEVVDIVKNLEFHEFVWVDTVRDNLYIVAKGG